MSEVIYKHLKEDIYYNELYDRFTIEECRRWSATDEKEFKEIEIKTNADKIKKLKHDLKVMIVVPTALYFIKGERYKNKAKTIDEWRIRDAALDDKVSNAVEPKGVRCLNCSRPMECTSRDLHSDFGYKNEQVLFFFECSHCDKRRAYWEGGQEWKPSPTLCPKCKAEMKSVRNRKDNIITTNYSCPKCNYRETDIWDLDEKKEATIDPNFETDRKKYCLDDKEGREYMISAERSLQLLNKLKDMKENKEIYDVVSKIKKLTIVELQNLLSPVLDQKGFIKFELGKPEFNRDLIIEFSLQDNQPGRSEYDSKNHVKKLIVQTLKDTNWRLMSDGLWYKLGFLTGRLRGIEGEEKLRELIVKEAKKVKKA